MGLIVFAAIGLGLTAIFAGFYAETINHDRKETHNESDKL